MYDYLLYCSSSTLANNLTTLDIHETQAIANDSKEYFDNFIYFKNYRKLKFIDILPYHNNGDWEPANNIYPYICIKPFQTCKFFKDINGVECPTGCNCYYRRRDDHFVISCMRSEAVTEFGKGLPKAFIGTAALFLNGKNLTKLPNRSVYGYSSIQKLYAARNRLVDLTVSQLPENLTYLDIRCNNLKTLSPEVIDLLSNLINLRLAANPWSCECFPSDFLIFVPSYTDRMILDEVYCHDGMKVIEKFNVCRLRLVYLVVVLALLIMASSATVFWFRAFILMWLHEHDIFVTCIRRRAHVELGYKFDAFLAFSHQNLDLIDEYVRELENKRYQFKMCFYHRDWLIGESIPHCILQSIEDSQRTIVLLTKEFLSSSWGSFEFRTAIRATSMDRNKRLIIIVYPEVEDFSMLDMELRAYMKYNTYLRRDDPLFWRKLIYAMPQKRLERSNTEAEQHQIQITRV